MLSKKHLLAGLVAGLALAGGAVAFAQPAPKPEPGSHHDRRQAMMQRVCAEMPARAAGRIAYTEVKIGITDQQRAAWQTFSQEVKAALQPAEKLCTERAAAPRPAAPPDAAAQLAEREKTLGVMLETTKNLRLAVEKLSPSLTEDQRKQLAELVSHMGHDRWGGRMMREHRMMHWQGRGPRGDANAPTMPPAGGPQR